MDINGMFNDFARAFEKKIDKEYKIRLQFEIYDIENCIWQIDINNGSVNLYNEEKIKPEETFILSKETLVKLYNNEIAPITAFAQENNEKGELCALIDVKDKTEEKKTYPGKKVPDEYMDFLMRLHKFHNFFSKEYPTKIVVNNDNGIKYNSGNLIGLYSKLIGEKRIIHVYFSIKKDEKIYQPGEEYCIYVINGKGLIETNGEKYKIEAKNYYHMIPKDCIYIKNENEELLEILYLEIQ
jgi:hypothetical protein